MKQDLILEHKRSSSISPMKQDYDLKEFKDKLDLCEIKCDDFMTKMNLLLRKKKAMTEQ